jgi:Flp pilus assembly protein TadG
MKHASGLRRDLKVLMLGLKRSSSSRSVHGQPRPRGGSARLFFRSGEEGQSLVEFALVLPLIFLISWGVFIFCIACNNYICLTEAAGDAALKIGIDRANTSNPCSDIYTQVSQTASTLNATNVTYTLVLKTSTGTTLGTYGPTKGSGFSCSGAYTTSGTASNYLQQGGSGQVTLQYPCNLNSFDLVTATCTLTAQTAEMIQ